MFEAGVGLPVCKVYLTQTTNDQLDKNENKSSKGEQWGKQKQLFIENMYLQFFMVKGLEEMLGDELTESLLKSQELCLNSTHKPPVHIKSKKRDKLTLRQDQNILCIVHTKKKKKDNYIL